MSQNRQLNVNWFQINVPTILAVVTAVITITVYVSQLKSDTKDNADGLAEFRNSVNAQLQNIQVQLSAMSTIPYRVDNNEAAIQSVNQRVDKSYDTIVAAIDAIRRDIGLLSTKVEVQSNKIDDLSQRLGKGSGAAFRP